MKEKSFEQNLSRVSEIAEKLDAGGLPLADSIELYKEAVETVKSMRDELETAKAGVFIMRKGSDGIYTEEEVDTDEF